MGQNGSCIQSSVRFADEESTYTSAAAFPVLSSNNTELLKHLTRRLSASDRHSKENIYGPLPKSRACPRHGNTMPQVRRQSQQRLDAPMPLGQKKPAPAVPHFDNAPKGPLYKETYCKRVNFNEFSPSNAKDLKTVSLKPVITKGACSLHGQETPKKSVVARKVLQSANYAYSGANPRPQGLSCRGKVEQKDCSACPVHSSSRNQISLEGSHRPSLPAHRSKQVSILPDDSFCSPLHSEGPFPRTSTPTKSITSNKNKLHSSHTKELRFSSPDGALSSSLVTPLVSTESSNRLRQTSPPPYRFPPSGKTSYCPKPEPQGHPDSSLKTPEGSQRAEQVVRETAEDDDSGVFTAEEDLCSSVQKNISSSGQNEPWNSLHSDEENSEDDHSTKRVATSVDNGRSRTDDVTVDSSSLPKNPGLDGTNDPFLLHWLKNVKGSRGKGIKKDPELISALTVYNSRETIEMLEERAEEIVEKFSQALKQLDHEDWAAFYSISSGLCADVKDILRDYGLFEAVESQTSEKAEVRKHATDACNGLSDILTSEKENILAGEKKEVAMKYLKALGETLHEAMEFLLGQEISVIVDGVKEGGVGYCAKLAVETLIELGQSGELMSRLITMTGGTKTLLAVYSEEKRRFLRPLVLRALNVLCSCPDTIREMIKAGGANRILEILCEEGESEEVLSQAAGLLAQIAAPTLKDTTSSQMFTAFSSQLVKTLAELAHKTKSSELFLLITTVLANLTVFSSEIGEMMKQQIVHGNSALASHVVPELTCSSDVQQEIFGKIIPPNAIDTLSSLNATDFVKAKLWDFLLLCCSRQESYV